MINIKKLVDDGQFKNREYYPSNNDGSVKKIAFLIKDEKDVVYDCGGENFVFGDGISPIVIDGCENIVLKNFTIDYNCPQHIEGDVISLDMRSFVLKLRDGFFATVENGIFKSMTGDNHTLHGRLFCQEFDPVRKAPYANTGYMYLQCLDGENTYDGSETWVTPAYLTDLGDGKIEFRLKEDFKGRFNVHLGGRLVLMLKDRQCSAIFITNSKNITLENVKIYRSPSMGVICQLSENVLLKNVDVYVKEGRNEVLSSNADATHFTNCSGKIELIGCRFYNMLDDGCNIHGIYGKIICVDKNQITIRLMHGQQKGVNYIKSGNKIAILSSEDYSYKATATAIESVLSEDKIYLYVKLKDVEGEIESGFVVDNITAMPEVYISNCKTGNNRPRGFLLTSVKPMLVEDCLFENMACGIHVTSDARDWFESGKVDGLVIRNNEFRGCNYAWGTAAIVIDPSCSVEGVYVHKNIKIENNVCNTYGYGLLYAKSVDGLIVKGNTVSKIYSERVPEVDYPDIEIQNCKNVAID